MSRVVIVGPGGLGSTIGALLAHKTSCQVQITSRPGPHIEAIRNRGLRLCGLEECTVQVDATDDPGAIRECDYLIYLVKAQDTLTARPGAQEQCQGGGASSSMYWRASTTASSAVCPTFCGGG